MLYSNYLRDKSQNAIKIKEAEGVPCILTHSKGKDLKDYQIYGNSYQATRSGRNLLPYPYSRTTTTTNGVTFTDNGDGSVTVNGTATANATWYFYSDTKNLINGLKIGDTVTVSIDCDKTWVQSPATMNIVCNYYNSETTMKDGGCVVNSTTKYKTITIGDDWIGIGIYIVVYSGQTINNVTLKAQIELGSTATEYERYGVSPSPKYSSEVQSVGDLTTKNMFDMTKAKSTSYIELHEDENYFDIINNYAAIFMTMENFMSLGFEAGDTITTIKTTEVISGETSSYTGTIILLSKSNAYQNIELCNKIGYNIIKTVTLPSDFDPSNYHGLYIYGRMGATVRFRDVMMLKGTYTAETIPQYEPYHKYAIPITVHGKNLIPNSDWMSGAHSDGFQEQVTKNYITEYTQNSISFNLTAWAGVSSSRFPKDSVKRIIFKINQTALNSDSYANFYISIQGYDADNKKVGNKVIYDSAVADKEYVFNFLTISSYSFYAKSTQFSFCILARKNALSNLTVYDIAYYADTDTTSYEPYISETKHIYLDEPLRKVGGYADYIDFKNQKVVRNILKQSLNANNIYKKLNNVIRIGGINTSIKQKRDAHILSTIFNYYMHWTLDSETIFHHGSNYYSYYWSVYWSRLGLTYDGTNVYRTNDAEQTQLTDSEIIGIANEWLATLPDEDKEIFMILDTPTEESISLPTLKAFKGTNVMSVDTIVLPSSIKTNYIRT